MSEVNDDKKTSSSIGKRNRRRGHNYECKIVKELKEITIKKEVVDPDDVEMLQDLILTCVNEALRKVDSATSAQFGKYNIQGLM